MMPLSVKDKASPRRQNPLFQFSLFGKRPQQRVKDQLEQLEQQSELLKGNKNGFFFHEEYCRF